MQQALLPKPAKEYAMPIRIAVSVLVSMSLLIMSSPAAEVRAEMAKNAIRIYVGDKHFTDYKFAGDQKYPYFWPVNGPISGKSVTTETSEPYPHHHSLFFGCDRVNGWNFWQDVNARGQIVSRGPKIASSPDKNSGRVVLEDICDWRPPGESTVMVDRRWIAVEAPDDKTRLIDFHIRLEPAVDVTIQKTNHALFSARVMPHMSVKGGGHLVNEQGDTAEKGTFGKKSPWCDYSGKNDDVVEGIAILDHPTNRWFPCTWFTRDYGFFSPTPMQWLEGGELALPKGESLNLRYRVIVHAGDAEEAKIGERFKAWREKQF